MRVTITQKDSDRTESQMLAKSLATANPLAANASELDIWLEKAEAMGELLISH